MTTTRQYIEGLKETDKVDRTLVLAPLPKPDPKNYYGHIAIG